MSKKKIAQSPGPFPVINSGREPLGYVDVFNSNDEPIGIASRGSVRLVTWTPGRFFRGPLNYSCIPLDDSVDSRYLYHFLLARSDEIQKLATHQGIPALNASNLRRLKVQIPPVEVQREVVRVLDKFTELEAELEARQKQYAHYRDRLIQDSVDNRVMIPLGQLGTFQRGRRFTKADQVPDGLPSIHYGEIYTHYGTHTPSAQTHVTPTIQDRLRFADPGDVIIAAVSETVEDVGKAVAWLGSTPIAIHDDTFAFRSELESKYVAYFFQTSLFHEQKSRFVSRAKIKRLSARGLEQILIPVPTSEEQSQIVAILDAFDALVNDLSSGLPAEIVARRKQYEYYRDRLLSFEELSA